MAVNVQSSGCVSHLYAVQYKYSVVLPCVLVSIYRKNPIIICSMLHYIFQQIN